MGLFQKIEGEAAVLSRSGGLYQQVDLYTRNGLLYAKVAGGFVKLMYDGSTSSSKIRIDTLAWDGDSLWRTPTGALAVGDGPNFKMLMGKDATRLGLPAPAPARKAA
jgi:hypothetical protein